MTATAIRSDSIVGLFIDLGDPTAAVAGGDWIASEAGARYVVIESRHVKSKQHAQRNRWRMSCLRLERDSDVPTDVVCWWIRWYPRGRR